MRQHYKILAIKSNSKKYPKQTQKIREQKPHTSPENWQPHNHQELTTDRKNRGEEASFYAALDWRGYDSGELITDAEQVCTDQDSTPMQRR